MLHFRVMIKLVPSMDGINSTFKSMSLQLKKSKNSLFLRSLKLEDKNIWSNQNQVQITNYKLYLVINVDKLSIMK